MPGLAVLRLSGRARIRRWKCLLSICLTRKHNAAGRWTELDGWTGRWYYRRIKLIREAGMVDPYASGMHGLAWVIKAMWYYGLLAWFMCGAFSSHVATEKDRCGICWFLWGVAFGPMALLAVVGLPDKSKPKEPERPSMKTHTLCPECIEPVNRQASTCRHCGSKLFPAPDGEGHRI